MIHYIKKILYTVSKYLHNELFYYITEIRLVSPLLCGGWNNFLQPSRYSSPLNSCPLTLYLKMFIFSWYYFYTLYFYPHYLLFRNIIINYYINNIKCSVKIIIIIFLLLCIICRSSQ